MENNDLFITEKKNYTQNIPLALRMTPQSLDEFIGQEDILGPSKLLRRAIESDRLGSIICYGPPGTGKSALARIIAKTTKSHFEETNAVTIGIPEIRKLVEQSKQRLRISGQKTILLLDEIHHFNRTQQDALLPDVEKGVVTLIGITTENPYFYVNSALLSRSLLFEFKPLDHGGLKIILTSAMTNSERGMGKYNVSMELDAMEHIINESNGDARRLLNGLEIGILSTAPDAEGIIHFDKAAAEECMQKKRIIYDKSGDEHYDHISAFIKSMRGSDPDAALYWMAKMLFAGEDPRFLARRIIICASEDVGNADPQAILVAAAALSAVEFVGMPEARIPLAQAVTYVACAPKSNAAYLAISKAEEEVSKRKPRPVPQHLKDANLDAKGRGHGKGYLYPHDYPGHFVGQEYLPEAKIFYEPTTEGCEAQISGRLEQWRKKRNDTQKIAGAKK